ncbi:small GTP-binding protein, putative [Trichomonas vaginalis G3]|uniref:Small GTP-binding protein, putative n=1 Tax=Trichomonas vaginalis (strain ATCC PRA-98 / G3) TaxID=412133 RepID=A2F5P5_TRIV3|nr:GTPase protein [Trichomonas vaginalis G3]EAX99745.1 small GTP-binding protein, putative [Trichomonas vaginalis G3]KAI5489027.1 GTPase protein [Trichomonas vaginalis G3]|eukprot:XP_001312675.1 small GTP-binding protein [Trichomonas vaginalis G3]
MQPAAKKVALIGTQKVGKTALLTKFHFGTFNKNTVATVGASFILHHFMINGRDESFQIWDTAGQERYRSLGPIYYRDASCAIAVFDLTVPESFEEMKIYINQFKSHCQNYAHICVVGNKKDIYKEGSDFDIKIAERYVEEEGFTLHLTSALTGEGVNIPFQEVAEKACAQVDSEQRSIDLSKSERHTCC